MSYILDALRKSEEKRSNLNVPQQQQAMVIQPESGKPRIVLPLVIMTGSLIAIWLFTQIYGNRPAETKQQTSVPINVTPVTAVPLTPVVVEKILPEKEPELPALTPSVHQAVLPASSANASVPVMQNRSATTPASPLSTAEPVTDEQPADINILSRHELPIAVQQSLPKIKIEGHIYDPDPSGRMVFINGTVRKEKQSIAENLRLEEITPNGVILSYQGTLFHIGVFEP